jgi:hypothetical protein
MEDTETKDTKSVSIRFPLDLLYVLREIARKNNRSLNGEVIEALQNHAVQQKKKRKEEFRDL